METRYRNLGELPEMQLFYDYAVDVNGIVWSFKNHKIRKMKPGWAAKKGGYLFVRLCNSKGIQKPFYVHRLVALAFLPQKENAQEVTHKDGDYTNNCVDNLEWKSKSENRKKKERERTEIELPIEISEKIKKIYALSVRKGVKVVDSQSFTNLLLENAMEEYVNRYGLKKLMQ